MIKHSQRHADNWGFWRPFAACLAAGLLVAGCATDGGGSSGASVRYPSTVLGYKGIDSVEFVKELKLAGYSKLVVLTLDTAATKLPSPTDNTYEPATTIMKQADSMVLKQLKGRLGGVITVSDQKADATADQALVLRGKIDQINPGSRAARHFGGFGAGSAWVTISGELVDGKSSQVLVRFQQRRIGAMGAFGGSYEGLLSDCVNKIGDDLGRLVASFKN